MTAATSRVLTAGDRSFPWRGELPTSWTTKPLKYLTRMNANTWGENTDPELLLRYVDIGSVNSNGEIGSTEDLLFENAPSRARRIVSDGDVLISTVRTYLRAIASCEQASKNLTCSTGFAVVTAGPAVDPRFLFYWARSSHFVDEIVSRSLGVSYPAINAAEIGNLPFPTIGRDEQQQIAAFLDRKTAELDAVLRFKERQLELLAEKRQALISQAVTRGLDPTAPLKPSGVPWLGDVPGHWEVVPLKYLAKIKYGLGQPPGAMDDGLPLLRATNVERGKINPKGLMFIDPNDVPYDRDPVLRTNDIIVVRSGAYTGDSAIVPAEYEGAIAGYDMVVRAKTANPFFLAYGLLSTPILNNQIDLLRMRAAQPHLNAEDLGECLFFIPPIPEQAAIVAYLDRETARMDDIGQAIRAQIAKVREYRQALISAAVTGKIDVRGLA